MNPRLSMSNWNTRVSLRTIQFWETLLTKPRSRSKQLTLQIGIAAVGFLSTSFLHTATGTYSGSTTLISTMLIVLAGEALPALLLVFLLIITSDYLYIPPIGSIFNARESFEHFLVISFTALLMSFLMSSLRLSYRNSVQARQDASRAKQEAESAASAMEKMLALVSHDVRNPLASVKATAQLILRFQNKPEKGQQLVNRIIGDLERIDGMIQTLLDVSRLRSGQTLPLEFTYCDLRSILSRTVEDLTIAYGDRFVSTGGTETLFGFWSPDGIRRAIENLAGNAVKYGSPTGKITILAARVNQHALLSVHNEGPAIPATDLPNLFETYQRGSSATQARGWGLGLALVKGIAEAHGGYVRVQSSLESGTTFTLKLPIGSPPLLN